MKRMLLTFALLSGSTAFAQAPLTVSLDPLPYGSVQLAYGQYLIPNVNGMNVLLYSQTPLNFAQPGQAYTAKTTLSLSPLPLGAIRMNDSQYMLPNAMPGVMVMVISDRPLNFTQTQMALSGPAAPVASAAPTSVTSNPLLNAPVASAPVQKPVTLPAPVLSTTVPTPKPAVSSPVVRVPTPAPVVPPAPAKTPVAPKPVTPAVTAAPAPKPVQAVPAPEPSPVAVTPAPAPKPVVAAVPAASVVSQPVTVEVREPNRLPRLPGLPEDLTGSLNAKEENGRVLISYSITNLGRETYVLKPTDLKLMQEEQGLRARLDRRNGNLTPGTLAPNKGEIGTISLVRKTNAPVTLTWTVRKGEQTYTLKYTVDPVVAQKDE